jgi:hypothetical protein
MDRSIARAGAWAGVIALVGIFGYHLTLMAVAGQRVSAADPVQRGRPKACFPGLGSSAARALSDPLSRRC